MAGPLCCKIWPSRRTRSAKNGDEALRQEAVRLIRQALAAAASPAQQAQMSAELGRWLYRLMATTGDGSLLEEILGAYAVAVAAADAAPRLRLQAARARAEILADARRWPEALEDYVTAIGLIGQVAARHSRAPTNSASWRRSRRLGSTPQRVRLMQASLGARLSWPSMHGAFCSPRRSTRVLT